MIVHQNDRETPLPRAFWERLPLLRPTVQPAWCVYCGERPPTTLCGLEHTAYAGEWLCPCCYWRLFEGPVLFSQEEQARHDAGERDGRRA